MDTRELLRILTGTAGAALGGYNQSRENQNVLTRQKLAMLMDEMARQQQQQNWQQGYNLDVQQASEATRHNKVEENWQAGEPERRKAELDLLLRNLIAGIKTKATVTPTKPKVTFPSAAVEADRRIKQKQGDVVANFAGKKWPEGTVVPFNVAKNALSSQQPAETTMVSTGTKLNPFNWTKPDSTIGSIQENPLYKFLQEYQYISQPQTRDSIINAIMGDSSNVTTQPADTAGVGSLEDLSDEELMRIANGG